MQFVHTGLTLKFKTRNQPRGDDYPTLRTPLLENHRAGRQRSFLAGEPVYLLARGRQARDLIVPIMGDVGGAQAQLVSAPTTEHGSQAGGAGEDDKCKIGR